MPESHFSPASTTPSPHVSVVLFVAVLFVAVLLAPLFDAVLLVVPLFAALLAVVLFDGSTSFPFLTESPHAARLRSRRANM